MFIYLLHYIELWQLLKFLQELCWLHKILYQCKAYNEKQLRPRYIHVLLLNLYFAKSKLHVDIVKHNSVD